MGSGGDLTLQYDGNFSMELALLDTADYRVVSRRLLDLSPQLKKQIYCRPGEGDVSFLSSTTLLFFLHDSLVVIDTEDSLQPVTRVVTVPQLVGFKVTGMKNASGSVKLTLDS